MKPALVDKGIKSNLSSESIDQGISEISIVDNKTQELSNTEKDIKEKLAKLETERIETARQEIQSILDKYGIRLQGIVTLPANQIQIVPER